MDKLCISQSCLDSPKRIKRKNGNKFIPVNQTLKFVENISGGVGEYNMRKEEVEELCRKAWKEKLSCPSVDRSKTKDGGRLFIFNELRNTYMECTLETKLFEKVVLAAIFNLLIAKRCAAG